MPDLTEQEAMKAIIGDRITSRDRDVWEAARIFERVTIDAPSAALVVVAIRTTDPHIRRRLETILAAAATYDEPPNTEPCVFAKAVDELTASDADHLAYFIGWDGFRGLNVGDAVAGDDERSSGG